MVTSSITGWNGEKYETVHDGNLVSDGETMINLKIKRNRSYAIRCEQPSICCKTNFALQEEFGCYHYEFIAFEVHFGRWEAGITAFAKNPPQNLEF